MIKITNKKNPLRVDFKNSSNGVISGTLLTYEITGEACVQVDSKRVWMPFSNLSEASQKKILGIETNGNEKTLDIFKEPKLTLIITLMVLIGFSYYYLKFNL